MELGIYSVFDSKLGSYLAPFATANHLTAIRQFETAVGQEGHDFNTHAEDFSLWHLGTYDAEKGDISPVEKSCIGHGHETLSRLQRTEIS